MTNSSDDLKMEAHEHHCHRRRFWKVPIIVLLIVAVKSALVLLLWNSLMPGLFHLPALNYLAAVKLTILAKILLGFGHHRHHFGRHGGHWKGRWAKLSPEEREKLREELRHRCFRG